MIKAYALAGLRPLQIEHAIRLIMSMVHSHVSDHPRAYNTDLTSCPLLPEPTKNL
jgi:hypothetical protein